MRKLLLLLLALLVFSSGESSAFAQTAGDPQAGKAYWAPTTSACRNCHGADGEGAFGPDLAGRGLSIEQFKMAVRKPWGVMPAYTETQISDADIANLAASFASLPRVSQPGPWRTPLDIAKPLGQQLLVGTIGCAQCHGAEIATPRQAAGGVGADYDWLAEMVYTHTTAEEQRFAKGRMGNYSKTRLPEALLREVWRYMSVDLGLRADVRGRVMSATTAGGKTTYTIVLENRGIPEKGFTAEDVTMSIAIPAGATVVAGTGDGYQGVKRDPNGAEMAVWQAARVAPKTTANYTLTLATLATTGTNGADPTPLKGTVRWMKPTLANGNTDSVPIVTPPPQQGSQKK